MTYITGKQVMDLSETAERMGYNRWPDVEELVKADMLEADLNYPVVLTLPHPHWGHDGWREEPLHMNRRLEIHFASIDDPEKGHTLFLDVTEEDFQTLSEEPGDATMHWDASTETEVVSL